MSNKKRYTKPAILIEDFKISNFVAGCGTTVRQVDFTSPETDGCLTSDMQDLNSIGFFIDAFNCTITAHTDDNTSGYCYFTYANSIFTS